MNHQWLSPSGDKIMGFNELREEILKRYEVVEKTTAMDFGQLNQEKIYHSSDAEMEMIMKANEEFE
jgi:hypothetical protein